MWAADPGALTLPSSSRAPRRRGRLPPWTRRHRSSRPPGPGIPASTSAAGQRRRQLPYPDDSFDAALAQLVVHFMTDPVAGLREMARVTRPDHPVAACVWDHAGGKRAAEPVLEAARELDQTSTTSPARRRARGSPHGVVQRGRVARGRGDGAGRRRRARDLRRVVGAVHAGRRARRGIRCELSTGGARDELREVCRGRFTGPAPFVAQGAAAWTARGSV